MITLPWLLKESQTDIHVWEHQNETINIPNMSIETIILDFFFKKSINAMTEFKKRGSLHRENSGDYQSILWIFAWNLINRNNNVAMGKSNPKMIRENNSQNFYWARNDSCSCQRKYKISAMMGIKQSDQQDFAWLRKQNQSLTKGCSSSP